MEDDPIIEVYHGTAELLGKLIDERRTLRPKPGNRYVYLTTDINVARRYSRAWTAWSLEDVTDKRYKVKSNGIIVKMKIRKSMLEDDPYNPDGEPDQYRIEGCVYLEDDEHSIEVVPFPELNDEHERSKAYCYWIGIARATD